MPLFSFRVDISGMQRRFHALVDATTPEALAEPLLRTGGFVRARIKHDVFDVEGPGWAELDPETRKRKMTEQEVRLLQDTGRGKMNARSPVRRIVREADVAKAEQAKIGTLLRKLDERKARGRKTEALERSLMARSIRLSKAVTYIQAHRFNAIAIGRGGPGQLVAYARREVERAKRHGLVLRAYQAAKRAGHSFSSRGLSEEDARRVDAERRALLRKGARRYRATEESTQILGGLRNSLSLKLLPNVIEIFSKAYIAPIHNFGGTAGHGAQIKARKFMIIPPGTLDFLAARCKEQMIEAWHEAV